MDSLSKQEVDCVVTSVQFLVIFFLVFGCFGEGIMLLYLVSLFLGF